MRRGLGLATMTLALLTMAAPAYVVVSLLRTFADRSLTLVDWGYTFPINRIRGSVLPGYEHTDPLSYVGPVGALSWERQDAPMWLWLLSLTPGLVLAGGVSVVALVLLRLRDGAVARRVLDASAAARLRWVAAVTAVVAVLVPLLQSVYTHALVVTVWSAATAPGWLSRWHPLTSTAPWLAVALAVLLVSQVCDVAARASQDGEGTP